MRLQIYNQNSGNLLFFFLRSSVHPCRHRLLPGPRGSCHPPLSSGKVVSPWNRSRHDMCSTSPFRTSSKICTSKNSRSRSTGHCRGCTSRVFDGVLHSRPSSHLTSPGMTRPNPSTSMVSCNNPAGRQNVWILAICFSIDLPAGSVFPDSSLKLKWMTWVGSLEVGRTLYPRFSPRLELQLIPVHDLQGRKMSVGS